MAAPVETKVKAATGGAGVGTAIAGVLTWALVKYVLPKDMDPTVQAEIAAAIPTVVAAAGAWLAGYFAKHTYRPAPVPLPSPPVTPATPAPPG